MSVTLSLFAGAGAQFLDNNGNILSGGLIYTYTAGTTTPLATYTTNLGTVAQPNPIVLDSAGRIPGGELWLTTGYGYKFVTKDSNGVLIGTYDNVPSSAQPPITNDASSIAYEQGALTTAGSFVIGDTYLITSIGTTNFQLIGAASNTVGIHFIATGPGTGTGTAEFSRTVQSKLQEVLSVKDFGAVGDGTTDDTTAIQNAIDYAVYIGKCALHIPAGQYKITKTLQVGYGTTGGSVSIPFSSFVIYGDGWQYRAISSFSGTSIIPTFNNAPAINFQCILGGALRDIGILGQNFTYLFTNRMGAWGLTPETNPAIDDLIPANWVDPSFPASSSSRYAPYAAISMDAYSGARAAVSYPDVTYPSFLGAQTQFNKTGISSQIELSNVYIAGFVVGFVTYPNGSDGQDEFIKFDHCLFEYNQYGIVITNTQAREFTLVHTRIENHYGAICSGIYGIQNGASCYTCYGSTFDRNINVMLLSNNNDGPTVLNGCYGESLYRLGEYTYTGSTQRGTLSIDTCQFDFSKQNFSGAPLSILGGVNSGVSVKNTQFSSFVGNLLFDLPVKEFTNNRIELSNPYGGWAKFRTTDPYAVPIYAVPALNGVGVVNIRSTFTPYLLSPNSYTCDNWNYTTGAIDVGNIFYPSNINYIGNGVKLAYSSNTISAGGRDPGMTIGLNTFDWLVGRTTYSISMVGLTATITLNTPLGDEDLYNNYGMNPGDVIIHTDENGNNPYRIFYIRARTLGVITAELQNGFTAASVPLGTIDNSMDLFFHCSRYYMAPNYQLSTATAGSAVLTAVGNQNGTFYTDFAVDDSFFTDEYTNLWTYRNRTRIVSFDAGAETITLNSTVVNNLTGRLQLLIKKAPANS